MALLKWIHAGLGIPEVRSKLHGDAAYLLSNLVAKYSLAADTYRITRAVRNRLIQDGIDIAETHTRSRFYGKDKPYMYEHPVPASLIRDELIASDDARIETVRRILDNGGPVVIVLREENELLRSAGV